MAFKDYWLNSDDSDKKKEEKTAEPTQAPTQQTPTQTGTAIKFPDAAQVAVAIPTPTIGATNCEPHMDAVMALYEEGFEGLNQPGVEFFEYFKSVVGAGIDNPGAYTMALNMLRGLDANMSKASLLQQSQFYIDEIMKVWQGYEDSGLNKKQSLEQSRDAETERMKSDLELMEQQLITLQNQIDSKKIALQSQTAKYAPGIEEIGCKMAANDLAKNKILGTINKVVAGINNNL